jgi:uncharacterized membrane protein YqjE
MLGGSFLFVSVVELIPGELEKMRAFQLPVFPVMASLLVGYALMTLMSYARITSLFFRVLLKAEIALWAVCVIGMLSTREHLHVK